MTGRHEPCGEALIVRSGERPGGRHRSLLPRVVSTTQVIKTADPRRIDMADMRSKKLACIGAGGNPMEGEVGVPGIPGRRSLTSPVDRVMVPGPGDDRLLLIPGERVAPALRLPFHSSVRSATRRTTAS
jgi:hypothetical protein